MSAKSILVPIEEFDIKKFKFKPIEVSGKYKIVKSTVCYLDDDDNECKLVLEFPKQDTFGFQYTYPFELSKGLYNSRTEEERASFHRNNRDKIDGVQINYPVVSYKNINEEGTDENYTEKEKKCLEVLDAMTEKARNFIKSEIKAENKIKSKDKKIPAQTRGADDENLVSPIYSYPKKDKPQQPKMYIGAKTYGKGREMKCNTVVYLPGDKKSNALNHINQPGKIQPNVEVNYLYLGGKTYGSTLKMRIYDGQFTPRSAYEQPRLSRPNNDAAEEFSSEEDESEEVSDDGFGDSINPVAVLNEEADKTTNSIEEVEEEEETEEEKKARLKRERREKRKKKQMERGK